MWEVKLINKPGRAMLMTIQELINGLQHAVDELGFDPKSHIAVDVFDSNDNNMTHWNIELDDTAQSEPASICINVYEREEA